MEASLEITIGELLRKNGWKLATAESCTGGLIGHRLTNVPGSSDYYLGGTVVYAYQAKVDLLGVSWDTLNRCGAVSRETVLEMAAGVRARLSADLAISVSGIAGPGGGTPEKPVGSMWIGLAASDGAWARRQHFPGDRMQIKAAAAEAALAMLLDYLHGRRDLDASPSDSASRQEPLIDKLIRRIRSL